MSRFIPQITVPVFTPDPEQPDPGALRARIYVETPVWVAERISTAATLAREVYEAPSVIQLFALQLAVALISLHGDGAPDADAFPPYGRDNACSDALRARADWMCANLSTQAIQRLLRDVTARATLLPEQEGN